MANSLVAMATRRSRVGLAAALLMAWCASAAGSARAQLAYTGVNLAGAEFGDSVLPGTHGTNYIYPNSAEVDYFVGKGVNAFRLPFRWERLQRSLGAALHTSEFNRLNTFVQYATGQGAVVVLDPHNYARYNGNVIGGDTVTNAHFADFWSRLATAYKDNPRVVFGLMNEPNNMPTEQWLSAANAAIAAIRDAGAANLILVPGNAWTGAHSWSQNWYGTPNATVMLGVVDPGNNYAFDVHQYLDNDSSGTSATVVSASIGVQRLSGFTNWLKQHNRRGFLGEFAVANSTIGAAVGQIGDEAITNMIAHMEANADVWLGWTWWAAGPWWGNYMFSLEPTNLGQPSQADRAAMAVLQPRLAGVDANLTGDYNGDGAVDGLDLELWQSAFGTPAADDKVGDADGDGDADGADFLLWQANRGATVGGATGSGLAADAVPEPASALLCLLVSWGGSVFRQARAATDGP